MSGPRLLPGHRLRGTLAASASDEERRLESVRTIRNATCYSQLVGKSAERRTAPRGGSQRPKWKFL